MQDITNFYRNVQERGLARDFQLRVLQLGNQSFSEDDLIFIRTATLPDREITNHAVPYMGLDFNVPGSVKYPGSSDWQVLWHADAKYQIREKLETWQRDIFDDATSKGNINIPGTDRVITLQLIDEQLETVKKYQLFGVYLTKLGNIEYNIQGTGEPRQFTSSLAYQYWRPVSAA